MEVIGSQLFLEPTCMSEETIPRCGKIRHAYFLDRLQHRLVTPLDPKCKSNPKQINPKPRNPKPLNPNP